MADGDNNNAKEATKSEQDVLREEARRVGEATVDEVLESATSSVEAMVGEQAAALKEHDALEEETTEAARLESELAKELEENGGWVKILGNEELMKKVIRPGQPNQNPLRGDMCEIRVEGRLASDDSVVFQKMETLNIQLGDAEVVPGLDLAIPLMTRGEVATIKVSQRFGFGAKGLPPNVPGAADLVYSVELVHSEPEKELGELTVKERRAIGNRKKTRGNFWYTRGEASLAVNCYRRALEFLDEVEGGIQFPTSSDGKQEEVTPELRQLFDDRLTALNNLAMAQLKLQSYEPALTSVEAVLKCQPNNVKALFRKGKILGEKGETEKALAALNKARLLEPSDASIGVEIGKLMQRRKGELQNEKQLYKRMFNKDASKSEDSSSSSSSRKNEETSSKAKFLTLGLLLSGTAIAVAGMMAYRYNHRFV